MFIEQVYRTDENGAWHRIIDGHGTLTAKDEMRSVEFWSITSEQETGEHGPQQASQPGLRPRHGGGQELPAPAAPRQPIGPAGGGVQGGYQRATTGPQAPQPPNEGSGVQPPAKKD